MDTAAFARSVDACVAAGGDTVLVPAGRHPTGAIERKSHVRLFVDPGATLLASPNAADYPAVEYARDPRRQCLNSLIYAHVPRV